MAKKPPTYKLTALQPRERRLAKEHTRLYEMCQRTDKIDFEITKQLRGFPPEGYRIFYRIKSIIGIHDNRSPIYGNEHVATIEFPPEYPSGAGKPICYMETDIWHPNIRHDGEYKGRICVDMKSLHPWYNLDMLVIRIGDILSYKNYLAVDRPPYPEDSTVAKWVREYAEPLKIVGPNIAIDPEELLQPINEKYKPRELPPKPVIKITRRGNNPPPPSSGSGGIIITKRP